MRELLKRMLAEQQRTNRLLGFAVYFGGGLVASWMLRWYSWFCAGITFCVAAPIGRCDCCTLQSLLETGYNRVKVWLSDETRTLRAR